ncbi:unnamed protein product [Colletotrichum noveboracense]|uniref:Arrestin-like N-terminal domain-containing protein n=1 Tax=Colletotrichum noveboracense TaxID=2664923 RepID=A0A9W4RRB9_9PEZI|nr:hypothetical protein K456DRAFT_48247 [Colletotrichum gloeosporioides 23]KAJ0309040.1 hypothetical protein Brms1b_009292 [Colletotrichum noveboracense]CAI0645304.1 unnamed protein product [Colletotrichum noveboracense]
MPPTSRANNDKLSIELLDPSVPSFPGSVIGGHIVRKAPLDAPSATVRARLLGRAKAKLVSDNGNSKSTYSSRFPFWDESDISDIVHEGAIDTGAEESLSWPFSLKIPTDVSEKAVNRGLKDKEKRDYFIKAPLKTDGAAEIPGQPLPGTFHYSNSGFSKKWHGYVEFWIEATITVKSTKERVGKTFQATLPIRVNSKPPPWPPISDFELTTRKCPGCVSSHRLVPGMEQAELSFKQKTRKFFGSSKVPSLNYAVEMKCPAVIQLGNPATIPFTLSAIPNWEKTSEVIANVPQVMTIKSVTVEIETTTSIICPGTLDTHSADKSWKMLLAKTSQDVEPVDGSLALTCGSNEKPLDLGAVLGVKLDVLGRVIDAHTGKFAGPAGVKIEPSYLTYCMKVEHMLLWEIKFVVGEESWGCSGKQKLRVLPQSLGLTVGDNGEIVLKGENSMAEDALSFLATGVDIASSSLDAYGAISDLIELLGG